jgi:hypothetical protein
MRMGIGEDIGIPGGFGGPLLSLWDWKRIFAKG